jgi:hypothetical protein
MTEEKPDAERLLKEMKLERAADVEVDEAVSRTVKDFKPGKVMSEKSRIDYLTGAVMKDINYCYDGKSVAKKVALLLQ